MADAIYNDKIVPLTREPLQRVATFLICQNPLLRSGIGGTLAGTRFCLLEEELETTSDTPDLILVAENQTLDEHEQIVRRVKAQFPSARIVILADQIDLESVIRLRHAGLDGVCLMSMDLEALLKVLELVNLGETFVPAEVTLALLKLVTVPQLPERGGSVISMPTNEPVGVSRSFSDREAEILQLLTEGSSNKVIARKLGVAEATVKVHLKAVLRKLNVLNRTQAAMWAQQNFASFPDRSGPALQSHI